MSLGAKPRRWAPLTRDTRKGIKSQHVTIFASTFNKNVGALPHIAVYMIKTIVAFLEGRLFSRQSELLEYYLNCSDCLVKGGPSKKATFVLIM